MKNIKLRIVYLILGAAADLLPECLPRAENAAYGDTGLCGGHTGGRDGHGQRGGGDPGGKRPHDGAGGGALGHLENRYGAAAACPFRNGYSGAAIRQHTRRGADSRRQRHYHRAGLP